MDFVDADGRVNAVGGDALRVVGLFFRQADDFRGGLRPHLRGKGIRVGLEADVAVGVQYFVFVERAFFKVGDEDVPDAALRVEAHDVAAAIPEVEVADDGDAPRIRRLLVDSRYLILTYLLFYNNNIIKSIGFYV